MSAYQPLDQRLSAARSAPVNHFIITCQPIDQRLLAALSSPKQQPDQRLLNRLISTSQPVDQHHERKPFQAGKLGETQLCTITQKSPDTPGSPEGNTEGPGTASSEPLLPS